MGTTTVCVLLLLALSGISAVPVLPETDEAKNENPTLATEMMPPPLPADKDQKRAVLFLINLFAVKNVTDPDALEPNEKETEVLQEDLVSAVPELAEPFATILLLVEEENEHVPIRLDEVAKDLEEEGFKVEKIEKDGQTRVIKVDIEIPEDQLEDNAEIVQEAKEKIVPSKYTKVRRRRSPCLKCKLRDFKQRYGGGGYGGGYGGGGCGYGGGCGGGRPMYVYPYPQQQQYYPNQGCSTCGRPQYGGGGGNSYSYAQASASAQAGSSSGGRY